MMRNPGWFQIPEFLFEREIVDDCNILHDLFFYIETLWPLQWPVKENKRYDLTASSMLSDFMTVPSNMEIGGQNQIQGIKLSWPKALINKTRGIKVDPRKAEPFWFKI